MLLNVPWFFCNKTLLSTVYGNDWLKLTFNCFFVIQSEEYQFQLTNHLISVAFVTTFFDRAEKTSMFEIKSRRLRSQILLFYFYSFIFKKFTISFSKVTLQKKMLAQGEHRGFTQPVFIDEECGNLIVHINQMKKSDVLKSLPGIHSAKNVVGESIHSVAMWNIYCESVWQEWFSL